MPQPKVREPTGEQSFLPSRPLFYALLWTEHRGRNRSAAASLGNMPQPKVRELTGSSPSPSSHLIHNSLPLCPFLLDRGRNVGIVGEHTPTKGPRANRRAVLHTIQPPRTRFALLCPFGDWQAELDREARVTFPAPNTLPTFRRTYRSQRG